MFRSVLFLSLAFVGFASEDTMMKNMTSHCTMQCKVYFTVTFTNIPTGGKKLPKNIKYTLRDTLEEQGELHDTGALFPKTIKPTPRRFSDAGML